MTPLEAMARAHYEWRTVCLKFDDLPPAEQQHEINSARAALTALRDADWPYLSVSYNVKPVDAIRAMLDAVLEEG